MVHWASKGFLAFPEPSGLMAKMVTQDPKAMSESLDFVVWREKLVVVVFVVLLVRLVQLVQSVSVARLGRRALGVLSATKAPRAMLVHKDRQAMRVLSGLVGLLVLLVRMARKALMLPKGTLVAVETTAHKVSVVSTGLLDLKA